MKNVLLIGIAIVALVVGALAVPKLDYRAAAAPSVEKVKAKKIASINIVADHLTAARVAACATEVALSPPDNGEISTPVTATITNSREIANLGTANDRPYTGPPLIARKVITYELATSSRGLDAPGWIELGGLVTAKAVQRE
jgi:hypothetical protein